ncbi:MAG: cytochrome d ubiquinol oxidase subunit II [Pseudomonadota bacterium]
MDLVHVWVFLVGLVVILYVILDGFSLGTGLLFPTAKNDAERDTLMNSIAPVWDVNQTWIVFGGGALFASFPTTYAVLFSALYIPLLTFIFGLIFRGVALEFRVNANRKAIWDHAFFAGSLVAVLAQGITLGAYISGIKTTDGVFSGGAFDWLTPFSVMVGVALIAGYSLLGATYLLIKTTGPVRDRAFRQALLAALSVAGFMVIVSIWTPIHNPEIPARWFSSPRVYFIWIFPLLGLVSFYLLIQSLGKRREIAPFLFSVLLFLSAYLGLEAALYPFAILPDITIFQAAAQRETQIFTLWGVVLVLPFVLGYTIYSYWVFRGKITESDGYH